MKRMSIYLPHALIVSIDPNNLNMIHGTYFKIHTGDEADEVTSTNDESNSDDDDHVERPSCSQNVFSLLEND